MSFWSEFKSFAMRGSVIDLAVGVIIGGAFNKIVTSLVDDVIMPPFSLILGKADFSRVFIALDGNKYTTITEAKEAGAAVIALGNFIQTTINFIILAFVIFLFIRFINQLRRKEEAKAVVPTPDELSRSEKLLTEIKELLARNPNLQR